MSSPKSVSPEKAEFNLRGYKHFVDQRNRRKQAHSGGFPEPGTICLTYTDASGKTHMHEVKSTWKLMLPGCD